MLIEATRKLEAKPRLCRNLSQKLAGVGRIVEQPVRIGNQHTVDPNPMHADRIGRQARSAVGQVKHAALWPAADALRMPRKE
jgi:hypothetical protein